MQACGPCESTRSGSAHRGPSGSEQDRTWFLEARIADAFLDARRLDKAARHATLPYRLAHTVILALTSVPLSWLEVSTQVRLAP